MPYGRYPERVKDFRKWSTDRVDKAKINDSVTGSRVSVTRSRRKNRRSRRRLKRERKQSDATS